MLKASRTFTVHSNEEMRKERQIRQNRGKHAMKEGKNSQISNVAEHPSSKARQGDIKHSKMEKFPSLKLHNENQ